uniref:Secreted protein n=1 Tax=Panagrellus redivivus TaxID=6233 RepID=A0A7E4V1I0_PANRE
MAQLTLIFVCFLSLGIYSVTGCLRTSTASSSGGEIPIPTTQIPTVSSAPRSTLTPTLTTTTSSTTTRAPCEQRENLALFYIQEDVVFSTSNGDPVSSCLDCDNGRAEYFASSTSATPSIVYTTEAGPVGPECPNFCVCDWNGECFRSTASTTTVSFYPYCSAGTC